MSDLKQLYMVAKVEHDRAQHCGLQYQQANAHLQANQQKLSGLERYRLDYLHTIRLKAQQGVAAMAMSQHHQFVGKLDKACEQQVQVINNAVLVSHQRKQQWLDQQKKHKAILHLIALKEKQIKHIEAKQEQKMFDELASQRNSRRPTYL